MRNVIMIAGIHGVGKSYTCSSLKDVLPCKIYSASMLISTIKKESFNSNKKIKDIDTNQNILKFAIGELIPDDESFILDGHFCLLDVESTVTRIPESTYFDLDINGIIVITDDTLSIQKRLQQRDQNTLSLNLINHFQNEELKFSKYIASQMNIPHLEFKNNSKTESLISFINRIMEQEE